MQQDSLDQSCGETPNQLQSLQVDGGMTSNSLLMQLQANILGCTVCESNHCFNFFTYDGGYVQILDR